jgi:hypothetical protein
VVIYSRRFIVKWIGDQNNVCLLLNQYFTIIFAVEEELFTLASEVSLIVRGRIGSTDYTTLLLDCQRDQSARAEKRKRDEKSRLITDPAATAAQKLRKNEKKASARKRRLDKLKPYRVAKRRRSEFYRDMDDDE